MRCLAIPSKNDAKVLIEGFFGDIESLGIIEGVMLEIKGSNGTLKMDLSVDEIEHLLTSITSQQNIEAK